MRRIVTNLVFSLLFLATSLTVPGTRALGQDTRTIWVAHRRVDCIGVAPQKCYLIKDNQYEDWKFWYSEIEGFDFQEGYAYELLVREVPVENPPADAPSLKLELVDVLLQVEAHDPSLQRPAEPTPPPAEQDPFVVETTDVPASPPPTAPAPRPETPAAPAAQESTEAGPPTTVPLPSRPTSPAAPPAEVQEPAAKTPTPAPPITAPAPTPGQMAGQIHRGHLSIGAGIEARSFKLCGAEESIWVEDRTEGDLWSTYRQMAGFPNRPLFMIVRGELQAPPPAGFGAHYPQQLLIYELRHAATESAGCFDDLFRLQFRATGNEPSWTLEISSRGLIFSAMGEEARTLFPYVAPSRNEGAITYETRTGGNNPQALRVQLRRETCQDTMVDAVYSYSAMVEVGGQTLLGCAIQGGATP